LKGLKKEEKMRGRKVTEIYGVRNISIKLVRRARLNN